MGELVKADLNFGNSISEALSSIRKRPAMYLGKPSIHHLRCYLDGWVDRSPNDVVDAELFESFARWVELKYEVISTQGWAKIIEFWSTDEIDALKRFYELWDEFQVIQSKVDQA